MKTQCKILKSKKMYGEDPLVSSNVCAHGESLKLIHKAFRDGSSYIRLSHSIRIFMLLLHLLLPSSVHSHPGPRSTRPYHLLDLYKKASSCCVSRSAHRRIAVLEIRGSLIPKLKQKAGPPPEDVLHRCCRSDATRLYEEGEPRVGSLSVVPGTVSIQPRWDYRDTSNM